MHTNYIGEKTDKERTEHFGYWNSKRKPTHIEQIIILYINRHAQRQVHTDYTYWHSLTSETEDTQNWSIK